MHQDRQFIQFAIGFRPDDQQLRSKLLNLSALQSRNFLAVACSPCRRRYDLDGSQPQVLGVLRVFSEVICGVMQTLNSTLTTYGKSRVKLPRKEMDLFSQAFTLYNQSTGITL